MSMQLGLSVAPVSVAHTWPILPHSGPMLAVEVSLPCMNQLPAIYGVYTADIPIKMRVVTLNMSLKCTSTHSDH